MHSIPESPSPERNIPQLKQTSPSHSSTELQSQQTNYENSDKISKDDSTPGSECNDECLGFKKELFHSAPNKRRQRKGQHTT
jgi:hypothetical protein